MTQPSDQTLEHPFFEVIRVTPEIVSSEIALHISEHVAMSMSVKAGDDGESVGYINLTATKPVRFGSLALPYGEVLILRIAVKDMASPSTYLACSKEQLPAIEKALFGMAKDFDSLVINTEIVFTLDDKVVTNVSNTLNFPSARLVAAWLDFSEYLEGLKKSGNLVVEEPEV